MGIQRPQIGTFKHRGIEPSATMKLFCVVFVLLALQMKTQESDAASFGTLEEEAGTNLESRGACLRYYSECGGDKGACCDGCHCRCNVIGQLCKCMPRLFRHCPEKGE